MSKLTIDNPEDAPPYWLYFRAIDPKNLKNFKRLYGREPRVKYPYGWWDHDHDRLIVGSYCVHHGIQEFKWIDNLKSPYKYDGSHRASVIGYLLDDHFKIEHTTINFTYQDRRGNINHSELAPIPSDSDYRDYLSRLSNFKKENNTLGKGVFLYVIHTENFEYFSVINFTNSQFVLGKEKLGEYERNSLHSYLESVGDLLEPCFNEVLLFFLEAYVRGDFQNLFKYLTSEDDGKYIKLEDDEWAIGDVMDRVGYVGNLWLAVSDVMEWLLECIHFDTILKESRTQSKRIDRNRPSYRNLIKMSQEGNLFRNLADRIARKYDYYSRRYGRVS